MEDIIWRVDSITVTQECLRGATIESKISTFVSDEKKCDEIVEKLKQRALSPGKRIEKVIFNKPATIILWSDGTKTVVKCKDGDKYDKQTGFLMCYLKVIVGNKTLLKEIDKWVGENEKD